MKKIILVLVLALTFLFTSCAKEEVTKTVEGSTVSETSAETEASTETSKEEKTEEVIVESWKPDENIEWVVTSSPGGGSSLFTQKIVDIINEEGLVDETIIVNYQTDGGGAVGRRGVSINKNSGHTLLTFNSGDLQPLVQQEEGDLDMLTPLAVMALDGQIILVQKDFKYQTIEEVIAALEGGERLIMGGSKADDEAIYNAMIEKIGGDMVYLRSDSTGDAITQLLGGHVDMAIAKPAASFDYITSGELVPIVAAGGERFGAPFDGAPTFKELGYDIEFEIYRGICGPENMSEEEIAFWNDIFAKVAATDAWKTSYIEKFLLINKHLGSADAKVYMQGFEDIYTN